MLRTWRAGRLFGIPIDLHWTLLLVGPLLAYVAYQPGVGMNWGQLAYWAGVVGVLFLSILAHELGHGVTANWRGTRAERIVIFPLGGGAFLPQTPRTTLDEVLIYAAGPGVNLLLGLLCLPILLAQPQGELLLKSTIGSGENIVTSPTPLTLGLMMVVALNVVLALGNLLPAYPLDGGRILRALLNGPFGKRPATVVVTLIGILSGLGLIWLAWRIFDPLLGIGAAFIAVTSVLEYRNGWQRRRLDGYRAARVVRPAAEVVDLRLYPNSTVRQARAYLDQSGWPLLPVYDRWNSLLGFVDRTVLDTEATANEGLAAYFEAEFIGGKRGDNLLELTERIVDADVYGAALYDGRGRVEGYVFTEDVIQLLDNVPRRLRRKLTSWRDAT